MIPVVRFRPGVTVKPTPAGTRILSALDQAALRFMRDILVTSGAESLHSGPHDPHPLGEAFDIHTSDLTSEQLRQLFVYLSTVLGDPFYLQYEVPSGTPPAPVSADVLLVVNPAATGPHIHIQRDKGTVFPPQDAAASQ